jgi:hypothetical protein
MYYGYDDFSSRTGGQWVRNSVVGQRNGEFEEIVNRMDSTSALEVAVIYVVPEVLEGMSSLYFPLLSVGAGEPHGGASQTPPPGQPYLVIENVQFQKTDDPILASLHVRNRSTTTSYVSHALTLQSRHADWKCTADDFVLASGQRSTIVFEGSAVTWQNAQFHCSGSTNLDSEYDEIEIRDEDGRYLYGYCWDLDGAFPCDPGGAIR